MTSLPTLRPRPRAIGLASAGVVLSGGGALAGVAVLVWFGVSAVLLVVVVAGWSAHHAFADRRRRVLRSIDPPQLQVGRPAHTRVWLRAGAPPPLSHLHDEIPAQLGARVQDSGWAFVPARRGRLPLGPVRLQRRDPFGLFYWHAALRETEHPIVWPRTDAAAGDTFEALSALATGGGGAPVPEIDDVSLREYRHGDPLARVHWKRSAQHGSLLVRRDEPGHTPLFDLVLVPGPPRLTDAGVDILAAAAAALDPRHPGSSQGLGSREGQIRLLTPSGVTDGDLPAILTALALTPVADGPVPPATGRGIAVVALASTELDRARELLAWVEASGRDPSGVFVFPCAGLPEHVRAELTAFTVVTL